MNLLNKLERRMHRLRLQPFFKYIIFAMVGVVLLDTFVPKYPLIQRMSFDSAKILSGEVWRIVSFLIAPPYMGNLLNLALMIYFYYFIGTSLEGRWGPRRFLLFYAIGALGAIIAGFITGYGTSQFLYMSMFFAFAIQFPDFQLLLFFVLPIKVKWLALFNAIFYVYSLIVEGWHVRAAILASLLNIILFFGGDLLDLSRQTIAQWRRRRLFKKSSR